MYSHFCKKSTVAYITKKKKGTVAYITQKKSRFAYKRGVLLGLKIIYSYFHKKGAVAYITKKSRFAYKRVVLLGLKISDFGWKTGLEGTLFNRLTLSTHCLDAVAVL